MEKITDLFKKTGDTKGAFHAKMGIIKGRYSMDLTEAKDINKRWQEYTEELYKKGLNMPANLEDSAVATRLGKVSSHPNPKEGQCQRMFKLPHNCTHFTCKQGNTQNPSS